MPCFCGFQLKSALEHFGTQSVKAFKHPNNLFLNNNRELLLVIKAFLILDDVSKFEDLGNE